MPLGIASAASQNELGRRILRLLSAPSISTGMRRDTVPAQVMSGVPISDLENREEPWQHVIIQNFFDTDLVEPVIPPSSVDPSVIGYHKRSSERIREIYCFEARNLPILTIALHPVPPFSPVCVMNIRL